MTPSRKTSAEFKSGFVVIIGAPNAGKSTLLNRVLGEKISITSKKPQTTRHRILGVVHRPAAQMVFLDTPGVHLARKPLNVRIVDVAITALGDADMILMIADLAAPEPASEAIIVGKLKAQQRPVLLALNKTDRVKDGMILESMARWSARYPFEAVVPISAKTGDQVEALLGAMEKMLPPGPPFFPEDTLTDMPERFITGEIIREKVFRLTGEEIPHAAAVTVESFKHVEGKALVTVNATIHVERDSQKGIVIGKGGAKLKQIGQAARQDIQRMLGTQVFLKLFVRVQKNWSRDTRALRKLGY